MEYKLRAGRLSSPEGKRRNAARTEDSLEEPESWHMSCQKAYSTEDGATSRTNFLNQKQLSREEKLVHSALIDGKLVKVGEDLGRNSKWVQRECNLF